MLELKKIKGNTYYIPSPSNVGLYVNGNDVILIDSGNDSDFGRQVLKIIKENNWNLKLIINTHSNADHCGGNEFLQKKTDCKIVSTKLETAFIENPLLEPCFLYGGFAFKDIKNKFLMAKPSKVTSIISNSGKILDTELEAISLQGHFFDMFGVVTPDGVAFLADSLFSEHIITKYHLFYLLDIAEHFKTLDYLESLKYDFYVPSHAKLSSDISELIKLNRSKIEEIISKIVEFCSIGKTIDEIISFIVTEYNLTLNSNQYILLGSTIRAHLSYLMDADRMKYSTANNKFIWTN